MGTIKQKADNPIELNNTHDSHFKQYPFAEQRNLNEPVLQIKYVAKKEWVKFYATLFSRPKQKNTGQCKLCGANEINLNERK